MTINLHSVQQPTAASPGDGPRSAGEGTDKRRQFAQAPSKLFPIRGAVPAWTRAAFTCAGGLVLLLAYSWVSHQPWVNALLPSLSEVATTLVQVIQGDEFWTDVRTSLFRVMTGFVLAAVLAVPLGILSGSFRLFSALLEPLSEFLRYVPVPALVPLVMVTVGIGESAKVALIFLGVFFQLLLMTADEVRRVPTEVAQVSQSLGATRYEVIRRVLTPAALPGIFLALRICNGWAWSYVVVAELVAATEGLGFRVLRFYRFLQTPNIYVYLIALGVIGLAFDFGFRLLQRRLFSWQQAGAK